MPMPPEVQAVTRDRLLEAAGEVFAELGYAQTTVREICQRAGANIAAVNYHFGGKDELYAAILERHFSDAVQRYPLVPDPAIPPRQALEQFVHATMSRLLDQSRSAWHTRLTMREITEPTPHLDMVAERFMRPHFAALKGILRGVLGGKVPEDRLLLLALSVMGQCTFYKLGRHAIERVAPERDIGASAGAELSRHIARVTLAAAEDLRREFGEAV
jgi:TetR/AcrR family transcriptional regulator, regulator of cefoperazone and chloramphenicol sensitivity